MPSSLIEYIKKSLTQGISEETVEASFLKAGWKKEQISAAFLEINSDGPQINKGKSIQENLYLKNNTPDQQFPIQSSPIIKRQVKVWLVIFLLVIGFLLILPAFFIGSIFSYIFFGILTNIASDQVAVSIAGTVNTLMPVELIFISLFVTFTPLFLYLTLFHKKLLLLYVLLGTLLILTPITIFFQGMGNYNQFPSKISRPEQFLIATNDFYIYDKGELFKGDRSSEGILRDFSKPPLIWDFDLETGKLKNSLKLQDEKSNELRAKLIPAEKLINQSLTRKDPRQNEILLSKPNGGVETYKEYQKNNEVLVYPKNTIGFSKTDGSRLEGYTNEIKLPALPVGLFSFQDKIYVFTSDNNHNTISLIKINPSTKEQTTLVTNDTFPKGYFYCYLQGQTLQIFSESQLLLYDLNTEKTTVGIKLNNKSATDILDIGENIVVYGNDGLKIVNKTKNKITNEFEGKFGRLLNYDENFLIWYDNNAVRDTTVYLFNKKSLQLFKLTGI